MLTVLIVIHLMIVIALVAVVLLQRSEGGALGVGGGSGGFMTGRGQANVLTRATAILAALFFATSLALTMIPRWTRGDTSILGAPPTAGSSETAPSTLPPKGEGSVLDQLRKLEQQRQPSAQGASTQPAVVPAPATQTPGSSSPSSSTPAASAPATAAPTTSAPVPSTPAQSTPATTAPAGK